MPKREPLLTAPFALAAAANFTHGLALFVYLHLPGYLADLHASEDVIGMIFGLMNGAAIAVRPFAGRVMDRSGRRVVIVAGGVVHVLACSLYLLVDDIGPLLLLVRVLQGIGIGALFSSLFTYAADIIPASRRTEGMGLFGVSGMLPISLGGLLGDGVLAVAGYHELFIASVGLAIVALLISLPLREPPRTAGVPGRGFFDALRQADLMPLWFVGTAFSLALASVFTFLKRYVEIEQVGTVGLFFTTYAVAATALRVVFGWAPDRLGPLRVFYPSMACISAGLATLAWAPTSFWVGVAGVLVGVGHGFVFPILSAIVVTRANPADRGSAMSLFTAVFDTGILIGGPLLGTIAERADLRTMYAAAALSPLIGSAIFAAWDPKVRPRPA